MSRFVIASVVLVVSVLLLAGCPGGKPSGDPAPPPAPAELGDLGAVISTDRGNISIDLLEDITPRTVANFCNLAQHGVFDGLHFHRWTRVVRQTGQTPLNYGVPQESHNKFLFDSGGRVAAVQLTEGNRAFSHPTQFFITVKNQERWDLDYTIFGNVSGGQSVADSIQKGEHVTVNSITIVGDPAPLFARFATDVADWDAAIDRAGLTKR